MLNYQVFYKINVKTVYDPHNLTGWAVVDGDDGVWTKFPP